MSEAHLSCYTRRENGATVLVLEGALDLATAPHARECLERFIAEHGPQVLLDTSRVDFIDSKGLAVLIGAQKMARDAGGGIYLPQPAIPVRKILETSGLLPLFPPYPGLEGNGTGAGAARSTGRSSARKAPNSSA